MLAEGRRSSRRARRPAAERLQSAIARGDGVGEEHQVELPALGDLRHLDVIGETGAGIDLRHRVEPGGDMVARRVKEARSLSLSVRFGGDKRSLLGRRNV